MSMEQQAAELREEGDALAVRGERRRYAGAAGEGAGITPVCVCEPDGRFTLVVHEVVTGAGVGHRASIRCDNDL